MGADLIGYFAKGPRNLPERAVPAAIAAAERRLDWLRRAQPALELADQQALYELLKDCPWANSEQPLPPLPGVDFEMIGYDLEDLMAKVGNVHELTGQTAVDEFRGNWPPGFRDAAHVLDPDIPGKLIVFAGDRTWGDTPDGGGFQLLSRAGILGIAPVLGVWVEAAFMTLHIPSILKGNHHDSIQQ